MKNKLSQQQQKFCRNVVEGMNQTDAYKAAGYKCKSEKVVWEGASQLSRNIKVKNRISELRKKAEEDTHITHKVLIERFNDIYNKCMNLVPVRNEKGELSGQWRFEPSAALKANEHIAKHLNFYEKDNNSKTELDFSDVLKEVIGKRVFKQS